MNGQEQQWKTIQSTIEEIKKLDIEPSLTPGPDGLGGHFREYVPLFRAIISVLDRVLETKVPPEVPDSSMGHILDRLEALKKALQSWVNFRPSRTQSPEQVDQEVIRRVDGVKSAWGDIWERLVSIVLYHGDSAKDFEKKMFEIEHEAKSTLTKLSETLAAIAVQKKDAEQAVAGIKLAAQSQATSSYIVYFDRAKKMYRNFGIGFLLMAIAIGIGGGWWGTYYLKAPVNIQEWPQLVAHYLPRLLAVTFFITAFVFALRNFQASMHNVSVYLHRMIVMQTFQAFRDSAFDQKVKDTILLQAVHSAVDLHQTGFLSGQSEPAQINQINEIKKNLTGE